MDGTSGLSVKPQELGAAAIVQGSIFALVTGGLAVAHYWASFTIAAGIG
ncbi:hypothetical protein [Croceicoccus gelatinilyticus]|nr:hypothetical protein [Croceicoccus gelatinilyticus]MBS7671710.1 hypothetical protein [Croceicoccus gelatinilyticus]